MQEREQEEFAKQAARKLQVRPTKSIGNLWAGIETVYTVADGFTDASGLSAEKLTEGLVAGEECFTVDQPKLSGMFTAMACITRMAAA